MIYTWILKIVENTYTMSWGTGYILQILTILWVWIGTHETVKSVTSTATYWSTSQIVKWIFKPANIVGTSMINTICIVTCKKNITHIFLCIYELWILKMNWIMLKILTILWVWLCTHETVKSATLNAEYWSVLPNSGMDFQTCKQKGCPKN